MYSYSDRESDCQGWERNQFQGSSNSNASKDYPPIRPNMPKRRLVKFCSLAAAVAVTAMGIYVATTGHNEAAACRGSGVSTVKPDGTIVTRWPDGAWKKEFTDGSFAWSIPAGSKPLPGTSPGHPPN